MAKPTTRKTLIEYCLRRLGAPVIEINVDQQQIEDRIDDALQFYQEYHSDAIVRMYKKHLVTATDITNKYIAIPDSMLFVTKLFPIQSSSEMGGWFSAKYQLHLNDIYDLQTAGTMLTYDMAKQYLSLIDMTLNSQPTYQFNRHLNRLYIDTGWGEEISEGRYLIVEGYETIDPNTYPDVYNDIFLKRYATALIKQQWGNNMAKFEGVQLPGGVTMNGQAILDQANAEIEKIEAEMQSRFEMPADFYVG